MFTTCLKLNYGKNKNNAAKFKFDNNRSTHDNIKPNEAKRELPNVDGYNKICGCGSCVSF